MIYVGMPLGSAHGWGICGKYVTKELSRLDDVRLITEPFDENSLQDEIEHSFFKTIAVSGDAAAKVIESSEARNSPVLQCVTSKWLLPLKPELRGRFNVGFTTFEEYLPSGALENARRHFDILTAGSTWCAEILRAAGLSNVPVVIQGVDPAVFRPRAAPKQYFRDRFVVFAGGKIEMRKGQDIVVRAFKVLQDRHSDVMLINCWYNYWDEELTSIRASPYLNFKPTSDTYEGRIRELFEQHGVDPKRIITIKKTANTKLAHIYHNTDVGIFPNRCEAGTSLPMMEYMACGKPVIASYSSGHLDILTDKNSIPIKSLTPMVIRSNGTPIATWDDPSLDETIEHLEWAYQHRDELQAIGNQAGSDLAKFTWPQMAQDFYRLLTSA